ncbi:MAG: extracellular solute-binding protein [Candidatus Hydrogenedentes bacterium]|nr:extracellular solute-binding protein [Candidatus Hydrogenedentota bacterium]
MTELISRALAGDQLAATQVVDRHYGFVHALCCSYIAEREDRQDVIQETFVNAWVGLGTLRDPTRFRAYLGTIARNCCLKLRQLRERQENVKQHFREEAKAQTESRGKGDALSEQQEVHQVLHIMIETLPAKTREVICLHYLEQMPTNEVAEALGISQVAVLKRLEYGRTVLRDRVANELGAVAVGAKERRTAVQAIVAALPLQSVPPFGTPPRPKSGFSPHWRPRTRSVVLGGSTVGVMLLVFGILFYSSVHTGTVEHAAGVSAGGFSATSTPESGLPTSLSDGLAAPGAAQLQASVAPSPDSVAEKSAVAPGTAPIQLRVGPPPGEFAAPIRALLEERAKTFTSSHPGISVVVADDSETFDPWSAPAEALGDILLIPSAELGRKSLLAHYVERGYLAKLDEEIAEPEFNRADFYPNTWDLVTYKNSVWAIPLIVRAWAIAVDTGVVDPATVKPHLQDWDSFRELIVALGYDPRSESSPGDSAITLPTSFLWEGAFLSAGGDPNNDAAPRESDGAWGFAFDYITQLRHGAPESILESPKGPYVPHGLAASVKVVYDGRSENLSLMSLREKNPDWHLTPAFLGERVPPLDALVVAVEKTSPEREAVAWEFVNSIASPEYSELLLRKFQITPLRRSVLESSGDPDAKLFGRQIESMVFHKPRAESAVYLADYEQATRATTVEGG